MEPPVDLLLITCNRRGYLEKMLPRLLQDPAPFNLYCWDNHSTDGTADIIRSVDDPRIVRRHFHPENVGQAEPCLWFFENSQSDVIGKVDDDALLPIGWIERIAPLIRKEPKFGMLGCWVYMESDWYEDIAKTNTIQVQGVEIFQATTIGGHSFLARREHLKKYCNADSPYYSHGLPIDRMQMSLDGLVSGYPLPLMLAHNMDDPRSPLNIETRKGEGFKPSSAQTARKLGFSSVDDYVAWIEADAYFRQKVPYERQILWHHIQKDRSLMGKLKKKIMRTTLPKGKPKKIVASV